jgi:Caspase domain/Divergent InlB B-repeat domain
MKKLLFKISFTLFIALVAFAITVFVLPCPPAQAASIPECRAVIVGITDYRSIDDTWYGRDNAQELYQQLSPVWGASNTKLLLDSQARKADILAAIAWLAGKADADDTVLFYFSGHGSTAGALCCYDASSSDFSGRISPSELAAAFRAMPAGKTVITLDCCYSGNFKPDLTSNDRVILMSTSPNELGWETKYLQHFVFTYYLLQAFANFDQADANHDYELSAEEIFQYANTGTLGWTSSAGEKQHPVTVDTYAGELAVLAKFIFTLNTALPSGTTILSLDGKNYTSAPGPLLWIPDVSHTITVPQMVDKGSGTRYVFTKWNDGSTSVTRVVSKGSYTASYDEEQLLILISAYGDVQGGGWYKDGTRAGFSVTPYIELADTKHIFTRWSGDFSGTGPSGSLVMTAPKTVTANWRHEYLLTINSEYGQPTGAGWYQEGKTAAVSVEPVQGVIIRHIFTGWSGDLTDTSEISNICLNSPKVITAIWRVDYLQLYLLVGGVVVLGAAATVIVILIRRNKKAI